MIINKALAHNFKVKKQNIARMRVILDVVRQKMTTQGKGCFIPDMGVAYFSFKDNTRDPICHLLSLPDCKGFFGPISEEAQKPLVRKLIAKFGINVARECERDKFVNFLQAIQDAHDSVWDGFSCTDGFKEPMTEFKESLKHIEFEYLV